MHASTTPITNGINGRNHVSSHVDVLIIGAGPTGLMSAAWMAELGLNVRIIDRCGTRALNGRADGLHVRSLEILDSFDLGHIFTTYGAPIAQWSLWVGLCEGLVRLSLKKL